MLCIKLAHANIQQLKLVMHDLLLFLTCRAEDSISIPIKLFWCKDVVMAWLGRRSSKSTSSSFSIFLKMLTLSGGGMNWSSVDNSVVVVCCGEIKKPDVPWLANGGSENPCIAVAPF